MHKYCFVFIICFIIISCAQKGKKYLSDGNLYTDTWQGYEIAYIFRLTGDSVVDGNRKSIKIKLPKKIKYNQSAWGSVYSGAAGKTKWDLYFIIADFDSVSSEIVFDKNKNCDFTDDTAFRILKDTPFAVVFKNPQDPNAEYRYSLRFYSGPVDSSREKFHKIMTFKRGDPLPATYMLLAKPFKVKKIRLPDGNIISLGDMNSDGMFTGKYDKIIAGDLEVNPTLVKRPLQCKEVKYGVELPFGNNTYKLLSADKYGDYISVIPLDKIVDTTERLAPIAYADENGNKKTLLLKNDKQYTIFYVWGTWCIGCLYQSKGFAAIMGEYNSKANFYTLNVGDKRERMVRYIADKKYPFQPYQVSSRIAQEKLFAEAFPTFIVADSDNKILLRTSSADELKKFLDTH